MATTFIEAISELNNYTQAEEDLLAIELAGQSKGSSVIFNTDLQMARMWNGAAFENSPIPKHNPLRVIIRKLSDLPTPISGVITLVDGVTYLINGTVDIGINRIVCGVKNSFIGGDRVNDKLTSTTTGGMFTMDGTGGTKSNILFSNLTIGCPNGTLLNVTSPAQNQAIGMIDTTISATANLGNISNITTWAMTNIVVRNCATINGFVISGTNGTIKCRLAVFGNNVGTTFDFGSSVNDVIDFNNNQVDCSTGQTFISGLVNSGNITKIGKLNDNIFTGLGTFNTNILPTDVKWIFNQNTGVTNTSTGGSSSIPIVTTNPLSPANGDMWILQASLSAGSAMGMLGMTYATTTGFDNFKLKLKTADFGIKEINFV